MTQSHLFVFCVVLFAYIIAVVGQSTLAADNATLQADDQQAWNDFKREYNKSYADPQEELKRQQIFLDNKRYVESFNTKNTQASFKQGLNPFFDMTTEEINASRTGFRLPATFPEEFTVGNLLQALVDEQQQNGYRAWWDSLLTREAIDFRERGVVSRVKDQGSCGSCWAFATTGALESALATRGRKILLSEQNLVDCSKRYGNNGCSGGLMDAALSYVRDHGIMASAEYPYEAKEGRCRARANRVVLRVRGSNLLPRGNERTLRLALAMRGPLPVAIDASLRSFHAYKSGVYDDRDCKSSVRSLNHAVLLVGYGTEKGRDFWLLKNSWGKSWGDQGYIKVARNSRNQCGVSSYAVLPRL